MAKQKLDLKGKANLLGKTVAGALGVKDKGIGGAKSKGIQKVKEEDMIDNPLKKVQLTSSLEEDCKTEADVIRQALLDEDALQKKKEMRERDKEIVEARQQQEDTEIFICILFEGRAQKEAFLAGMGWQAFGDKYMNGLHLARKQNIKLPEIKLKDEKGSKQKMYADIINRDLT